MTTISSRTFPAPAFSADEPLRLPRPARRTAARIDAARQLRVGVWLVLVISIGFGATVMARPAAVDAVEGNVAEAKVSAAFAAGPTHAARPSLTRALAPAGTRLALAETR